MPFASEKALPPCTTFNGRVRRVAGGLIDSRRGLAFGRYDVTAMLHPGNNTLAVLLGRGWYSPRVEGRRSHAKDAPRPPQAEPLPAGFRAGNGRGAYRAGNSCRGFLFPS